MRFVRCTGDAVYDASCRLLVGESDEPPAAWFDLRERLVEACTDASLTYGDLRDDYITVDESLAELREALDIADSATDLIYNSDSLIPVPSMSEMQPFVISGAIGTMHDTLLEDELHQAG